MYQDLILSTGAFVLLLFVLKSAVLEQLLQIDVSYVIVDVYLGISLALNILVVRFNYEMLCVFYASRRKRVGNATFQVASILLLVGIFFGGFWLPFSSAGFSRGIEFLMNHFFHPEINNVSLFNHKDESGLGLESLKYLRLLERDEI
jgi:hypothetical protein